MNYVTAQSPISNLPASADKRWVSGYPASHPQKLQLVSLDKTVDTLFGALQTTKSLTSMTCVVVRGTRSRELKSDEVCISLTP